MIELSLSKLCAALESGTLSSEEVVRGYLERISQHATQLNCLITVTGESAIAAAQAADRQRAAGTAGPLTGIPIVHKDVFCTRGVKTSCGSRMLDNFVAPYDATVVERTLAAGMVMLGKSNMDEFAMGSSNENSYYGPVRNPWDPTRVPGGSSGGSAAAVAARLTPLATGTDTGGSIRQPAALCGITGLKPTYGRVSRHGLVAFASSLDQAGGFGHSARDVALLLNTIAGFDERDSTSVDRPAEDYPSLLAEPIRGLKAGLPKEYFAQQLDEASGRAIEDAIRAYEALGVTVQDISLPNSALALPAYYVVAPAECSSNLSRFDGVRYGYRAPDASDLGDMYERTRGEGFGEEVKRRIMIGTYALSTGYYDAYYLKAQQLRRMIRDDFCTAFETVDMIIGPTTPGPAFKIGERSEDPLAMYSSDIYTLAVNLAGLPAISVPVGFADGLPVGLQIIGNYFDEARLLNAAHQYQLGTDWHNAIPKGFA